MDALNLDTPALYVDLDVLERNITRMQEQCRGWGVELRPHVKTHKIAEIAQMQLDAGAIGITVAKLGEAEVLPGEDVLVAYPLVKAKLPRLRELAKRRRVKPTESWRSLRREKVRWSVPSERTSSLPVFGGADGNRTKLFLQLGIIGNLECGNAGFDLPDRRCPGQYDIGPGPRERGS